MLPSHSCRGTLQNLDIKLLHSSMQTSADHRSRRRHVSHMTDDKGETWSPSRMSKVRSRPESVSSGRLFHALSLCYSIVCHYYVHSGTSSSHRSVSWIRFESFLIWLSIFRVPLSSVLLMCILKKNCYILLTF